jgi:hypothetical protein
MKKTRHITIAAIIAAGLIAGCGSSGNHKSAWTKADTETAESELASAGIAAGPLRACLVNYIEARVTPAEAKSKSSNDDAVGKAALAACGSQVSSSASVDHTSEWTGAKTQELENLLTAEGVTNMSCYVQFVQKHIAPLEYTSGDKQHAEQVGKEAAVGCHPQESKEQEESLEAEHKELEKATNPTTTPETTEEP